MISHLVDKELPYKSYFKSVQRCHSKFFFHCKMCQFHDLLTPVTIILLSVKRNKMLSIKTKFDTFQILGKEEFSKRTNTHAAGKVVTIRKY